MNENARLSKLLFSARDELEAWADLVERRYPWRESTYLRRLVQEIDDYRAEKGWSPHGFGGEQ